MKYLTIAAALMLAACTTAGGGSWSASSWNGLAPQTLGNANYQYFAVPLDGQGFKLKFTVKTNGDFGVASAPPSDDDLEAAARAAAPEGCTFVSLERTEDGGAEASYDCD